MSINEVNQMAADGQRSGKFRHVYGDEPTKDDEQYTQLKNPHTSGESSYLSANHKFFAVPKSAGGGPVYILKLTETGRIPANKPLLSVQKGKVLDSDFHPFIPNMIATGSEDCSVAVTQFPEEGLTESVTEAAVMLKGAEGHGKKVALVQFNPSANSILASGSFDRTVKVWNIEQQACINSFNDLGDNIYSLEWNYDGSQLACTGKDKKLRIFDPRMPDEAACVDAFDGTKSSKCFWIPMLGWIGSTGFSKQARRQLKFWDLKDLSQPTFSINIDQAGSILMPHFDNDNGLLYMFGKGEGRVTYGEIINDNKKWYQLGQHSKNNPQKGGGWVPKKACDVWKCEVQRFLKLTGKSVIPVSFIVPRKAGGDVFQEDIYPDCYAGRPALSADEWASGGNCDPLTRSMNPANNNDAEETVVYKKKKTYAELEEENNQLRQKIRELEDQLGIPHEEDEANADNGATDNNGNDEVDDQKEDE